MFDEQGNLNNVLGNSQLPISILGNSAKDAGKHFQKDAVVAAAAEIKENHDGNAYNAVGDRFYKGVGVQVDPNWSLEEKLNQSKLDWDTKTSAYHFGENGQFQSEGKQVVYRVDPNGKPIEFCTTNTSWQPYQNTEVVGAFEEFCDMAGVQMERLGYLRNGELVFCSAIVNQDWQVLGSEDIIAARLVLINSHKYGTGLVARLNAIRLVCANGLTRKVNVGVRSIGHNQKFTKAGVHALLESSKCNFQNLGELIDRLAQTEVSQEEAKNFLVETLGDRNPEGELESFDEQNKLVRSAYHLFADNKAIGSEIKVAQGTAWGLLNAVTEELNHGGRRTESDVRLDSLWNGGKADIMTKVLSSMEVALLNRQNQKKAQTVGVRAL